MDPFKYYAANLVDFFNHAGRGFYVPHYQREYSWGRENGEKLLDDIRVALLRTISVGDHAVFLGTVIVHDEKQPEVGVHYDTPNLLTEISNVVDGQQRITSIALLACVLSDRASALAAQLYATNSPLLATRATELEEEKTQLLEFFSVEIKKQGTQPPRKPIIIRAGDVAQNPASDQWTRNGSAAHFYRSKAAAVFATMISGGSLPANLDGRLGEVASAFGKKIDDFVECGFEVTPAAFLSADKRKDSLLYRFLSDPPVLSDIESLSDETKSLMMKALRLQALSRFLSQGCWLMVIDATSEALAFDMFQALNATGTPLTAFEVFKPSLVRRWRERYPQMIKPEVDAFDELFEDDTDPSRKAAVTDQVIVSAALVYEGRELNCLFSEERNWLVDSLGNAVSEADGLQFVRCLADQARYHDAFVRPRKPKVDAVQFDFVDQLRGLGMAPSEAEEVALCLYFLREAQHRMAHSVLSVFYARLLRAQGQAPQARKAAEELHIVAKATAAFFVLWMGGAARGFPDEKYRQLFRLPQGGLGVAAGGALSAHGVCAHFRRALVSAVSPNPMYDADDAARARLLWTNRAEAAAWYTRRVMCRFALFAAFDDAVPDAIPGKEGLHTGGRRGSAPMLSCQKWHSSAFEVVEHVAVRDRPPTVSFPTHFDPTVYPGNYSIVDRLGNLTLLSRRQNSSIYSEWPDKVFFYWSLTTASPALAAISEAALMRQLGVTQRPPALPALAASAAHLPHLAPLVLRGQIGGKWDRGWIEARSRNLCDRVFTVFDGWLRPIAAT